LIQVLADATRPRGGAWSPYGVILYVPTISSPVYQIPASGGTPAQVTELNTNHNESHRWPVFLADGKHFLFYVGNQQLDLKGIYVASVDSKERHLVVKATAGPAFASRGTIVYMRNEVVVTQGI
jgi:hypothetical protein